MNKDLGFPIAPLELKLEITQDCNLSCSFCYLGDLNLWRKEKHMPENDVFQWIDWAVANNIPSVLFTGGEATLHPKLQEFCTYAFLRNRRVIINTNGMAAESLYDELMVSEFRVSIPCLDSKRLDDMTGHSGVLDKKLAFINRILSAGKSQVCIMTVLTPELIGKLEEFMVFLQASPGLKWVPLRYESSQSNARPITRQQMQAFAEEMSVLMDRYPDHAKGIFVAAPFCSVTPKSLGARVFRGRVANCGPHSSLNVNFKGNIAACLGVCELSKENTLEDIKNSPKLHDHCSLDVLPPECRKCEYVARCAGGCRKSTGLVEHNGHYIDYLAGFAKEHAC